MLPTALGVASVLLAAGCGSSDSGNEADSANTTGPAGTEVLEGSTPSDFAGRVDVGDGRSIYMECSGSGGPTVVLVSGLGERADNWMATSEDVAPDQEAVFPGVGQFTRVCAYDRPGTGSGEAGEDPS